MGQCNYQKEDCEKQEQLLLKYVANGLRTDVGLCLEHFKELYKRYDEMDREDTYVRDVHILKHGRIWRNGYEPQKNSSNSAEDVEE